MDEQDANSEIRLPVDEAEVIEMVGAETDKQKNLAVAQARLVGDVD